MTLERLFGYIVDLFTNQQLANFSAFMAVVFAWWQLLPPKKKLWFFKRSFTVEADKVDKYLALNYKTCSAKNITFYDFCFFLRKGREIRPEDIPQQKSGVIITLPQGVKILDCRIPFVIKKNNDPVPTVNGNKISIDFHYLNIEDGFNLRVATEGILSTDISIEGNIIGGILLEHKENYPILSMILNFLFHISIFIFLLAVIGIVMVIIAVLLGYKDDTAVIAITLLSFISTLFIFFKNLFKIGDLFIYLQNLTTLQILRDKFRD